MNKEQNNWANAIVFISSTFNDMHAERDYLIKEVFPKLTEWCEERKIRLTDIDLRWGVSEEDSSNSKTIETCLRHVDKSRPFFLCFLGQRRGWVPNFEKDISKDTKDKYDIDILKNRSATEMEIEHALLEPLHIVVREEYQDEFPTPTKHSLFFFRNGEYAQQEAENLSHGQRLIYTNEYLKEISISKLMDELKEKNPALYNDILDNLIADFKSDNLAHPQFISELVYGLNEYDCEFYNKYLIEGIIKNPLKYIDIIAEFKFNNQRLYKQIIHTINDNDEGTYKELIDSLESYKYADVGIDEFIDEFSSLDTDNSIKSIKDELDEANLKEFNLHETELKNYRKKIDDKKTEEDNKDSKPEDKVHVIVNDYNGTWNSNLKLPELAHYRHDEGTGRLTNFECNGQPLRDVIISQFIKQFEIEFKDHIEKVEKEKRSNLDLELREDLEQQDNFRFNNSEGFVKREDYTNNLKDYVKDENDNKICVVSAKGGYGKTMLLANFATIFSQEFEDTDLYARFCGNSKLSSKTHSLWKSIVDEAGIMSSEEFYPHTMDDLRRNIDEILNKIAENGKTVIILDAINQLDDGLEMFKWLGTLPDNLKLIISVKTDDELEGILTKPNISQHQFEMEKLDKDKEKCIEKYLNKLNEYAKSGDTDVCLVESDLTYDKTLIFDKFRQAHSDNVYSFSCRVDNSKCSSDRVVNSIREIAGSVSDIKTTLKSYLDDLSSDSIAIIDALSNQKELFDELVGLDYNFKIIVGIKKSDKNKAGNVSGNSFTLVALDSEKNQLIDSYLRNYLKELDEKEIYDICNFEGSENPLYLKILLAELRVFGSFDQLKDEIHKFGTSPLQAFNQVLERLEKDEDYVEGENIVPSLFSLLAASRVGGLSEDELISIILNKFGKEGADARKAVQDGVRLNLRQVRPFMARKEEGRHDFFYEQFWEAASKKYSDKMDECTELLTDYFKNQADPDGDYTFKGPVFDDDSQITSNKVYARPYVELPYYLNKSGRTQELEKTLSTYAFIRNKLYYSGDVYSLILDYQDIGLEGYDDDHPLNLISRALELSSPVLMKDEKQLPAQLWGRMNEIDDPVIKDLLKDVENSEEDRWLKPSTNVLYSPKNAIIKRLRPDGKKSSSAVAFTDDKLIILGNEDGVLNLYDINDNTFEILEKGDSKVIKILLLEDGKMYVARENGLIAKWDIANRESLVEYDINDYDGGNHERVSITDIYFSKTYNKIYASSHDGIFTINLETTEIRREGVDSKDYNYIAVPRRNEAILVCDEKEVDGWDVYEMRKAYNQHHQRDISDDDEIDGSASARMDTSGNIKFMGLIKRFLILISENGQMKMWNTLKNSGGGSIDEQFTNGFNDQFRQAVTLEKEKQVITMSKMGVLNVWNIPEPKNANFRLDTYDYGDENIVEKKDIQSGIVDATSMDYYGDGKDSWVIIGNEKNDINIIDLNKKPERKEGEEKEFDERHGGLVFSADVHNDDIITFSENGDIFIWDLNDEHVKNKFELDFRSECSTYDDGKLITAGVKHEKDRKINKLAVFNVGAGEVEDEKVLSTKVIDIDKSNDGIVYIDESNLTVKDDTIKFDDFATTLCAIDDSSDLFIGFENGNIAKYSNGSVEYYKADDDSNSKVTKIISSGGNLIVGYGNGNIRIFDYDGNFKYDLKEHEDEINNIYLVNDSELISVSKDGTLKLWNIESKECVYTYYLDIYATSVNVYGDKLIMGDTLGNVRFFDFKEFEM